MYGNFFMGLVDAIGESLVTFLRLGACMQQKTPT